MTACQGCGASLPPKTWRGRDRKWCSDQCRKRTLYSGTCTECGASTNGSNGIGTAAKVCRDCLQPSWTPQAALDSFREWGESHGGIPPRCEDAHLGHEGHGSLPYAGTVKRLFGSWNAGLLAAGYEALHADRRPETQAAIEAALRAGEATQDIADRFGVTASAIHMRLRYRGLRISDLRSAA